jgi:hypothetical protein
MNLNDVKETVRGWVSPSRHQLIPRSKIKARRFFEEHRGQKKELALVVVEFRDGPKAECFESETDTRSTGTLFRNCKTASECFETFERYLAYN